MLTSLYIEKPEYRLAITRLLSKLLFDYVSVEIRQAGDVKVKCIEYLCHSGEVNFRKLDRVIGAQRNRLLCDKDVQLPKELGYRRFDSDDFKARLVTNTAISILCGLKNAKINVGLVDIDATLTTVLEFLLKYTDSVVVVSKNTDVYSEVAESLLYEIGAPIRLSKTARSLYDCDLIIAPYGICDDFSIKQSAILLCGEMPKNDVGCTVVYDYTVELPQKYSSETPKGLSTTYFASALYTLGQVYQLGSLVPDLCVSNKGIQTISSLKSMINKGN